MIEDLEKCIRLPVQSVERKLKFLSNLMDPDRYIVGIVIRNIDQKDIRKKLDSFTHLIFFKYLLTFLKNKLLAYLEKIKKREMLDILLECNSV
jgi:hypothetical protein